MTIKEYRAKGFMELMGTKPHTALRTSKLEELRDIDKVIINSRDYHEELKPTKYGYIVKEYK